MGFASEWVKGKDEDNIQGTIRVWSHLTARAGEGRRRGQLAGAVTAPVWDFWWDIIKSNRSRDPAVRGAGGAGCKGGRDVIVRMTFMTGRVEKTVQTRSPGSPEGLSGRVE